MKIEKIKTAALLLFVLTFVFSAAAQNRSNISKKTIVFALVNDGQTLEPIAYIQNGKLINTVTGGDQEPILREFSKIYYPAKTSYQLIFGGSTAGTVTVLKNDPRAECAKNLAEATTRSSKANIKGFVMGLATNAKNKNEGSGVRRLPTPVERTEIEALVREEFARQNVSASNLKNLRYHNLTALDVDKDGQAEQVGTFWVETAPTERALLFFIAEKDKSGKYRFGFSEYAAVGKDDVMTGEMKDLDAGYGHKLLLDIFDTDDDGVSEIFVIGRAFEGNNFYVYRREDGKWTNTFETYNYRCAF